ncbi:MAG: glycosyltransferase family 4 protein [Planctomycetaceae bacterium]
MSRDLRVLFLSHYFPPEGNAPATRVHAFCRRWVRRASAPFAATVITCAPNVPDGRVYEGYSNRLSSRERIDGIDVIRVWTYLAPNAGTVRRILNYVSYMVSATIRAAFTRRPDVVIATSPQFFCGWAGVLVSWLRWTPFILEIRDIWPESIVAVGAMRTGRLVRLLEWLELRMYAAANHVVTVGEGYRRELVAKGVPERRITIVTNGIDAERLRPQPPDPTLLARYNPDGRFVCSYIGTVGMAAGLDVVLRAAEVLRSAGRRDVRFLIVGDGATREELAAQVTAAGLDDLITVTGRQPKHLMPGFLSISDCCLVHLRKTALFETVLPSKIFEAAALEKPIVMGVGGFAADLVREAGCGICIEPGNAADLLAAIDQLRKDPARRAELGRHGRERLSSRYDVDRLAEEYAEVVERVRSDWLAGRR